ncbi:sigma-70 family RNA polymerase sigma factor [Pedobacter sp. PAMC26386]|nr:sigma-70 family RNA polymerase sigma factor [Pedobacter sp. PAMC26386]
MQIDRKTAPSKKKIVIDPHLWVDHYSDFLYRYTLSRISDDETARDLVQETFLAALESLHKFEGRSKEITWLTAILKNKIIDTYRKNSSGLNGKMRMDEAEKQQENFFEKESGQWKEEHVPQSFSADIEELLINEEFNEILRGCLSKLPPLWSAVFTMKYLDEEDTYAICENLCITHANFWVIIHRTKLNLRDCLQTNWI